MKTIGLLAGMSWESSISYYRAINEGVKASLGGLHSAKIIMYSVDFEPIEKRQHVGDWQGTADILIAAAKNVQAGGADFLLICTNTMHKVAQQIEEAIDIPLLHIADATAQELVKRGVTKVGLLGTRFTMEEDFYKSRLSDNYGLTVVIPEQGDRDIVHRVIYEELCLGKTIAASRAEYLRIIDDLASQGAQAVILGCTEIAMLVKQTDSKVMLLDTTALHAQKAVEYAI
ncbi:aspartate/glutamate racemase family protein [Psychromonas sp. MME2]|uniref:aspartate/glutamate racemase family protein n=1 Tax=unclassified Psychromonas TaxID=2614957 RepID=UPI00339C26A6